ncbi:MAG TPA: DUF5655 domain-containing protein [Phenylobacterium sp.]|nr:DUF5655 domain-containing protein [Phenylobacterium sp.]
MPQVRDWTAMRDNAARLLEERTGHDLAHWLARARAEAPADKEGVKAWLTREGVTGYGRDLVVWEVAGYPDFLTASANELIDGQYAGKPHLRPIYDALIAATAGLGQAVVQSRKTYVSLVAPKRTFAIVQAGKTRVELALRLKERQPSGRLERSRIHENMPVGVKLARLEEVDDEVLALLREAYEANA